MRGDQMRFRFGCLSGLLLFCSLAWGAGVPQLTVQMGHGSEVIGIAFFPNNKTVATASRDSSVKLWDVASGRLLRTLAVPENNGAAAVAVSPDGKKVASASQGEQRLTLWEATTGKNLGTFTGHEKWVGSVAFSPDGKMLASGSGDTYVKLWDVAGRRELRTLQGHTKGVTTIAFSPDGKVLISGSQDRTLKLWDVASGQALRTLAGNGDAINSAAFSPDGKTVVSGCKDGIIKLWDVASGRELRTLIGHVTAVESVAFSPDGRIVASVGYGEMKFWDAITGRELQSLSGARAVAFSPDGKTLATWKFEGATLWDVASARELRTLVGSRKRVYAVAFSPDGKSLASGNDGNAISLWDAAGARGPRVLKGHVNEVYSVAFSPDGKLLASGSLDNTLRLWNVADGKNLHTLTGHGEFVFSIAFSPDGKMLASGSDDKTIRLWDVASGRELRSLTGHDDKIRAVVFSPDGKTVVSGSNDKTIRLWDVVTGRELNTPMQNESAISSLAFSPDGRTVASGSQSTLKIWDVATGRELRDLVKHGWPLIDSLAFSPDGKTVVTGSSDTTLTLWDTSSGRQLHSLVGHIDWVTSVAFSPNGKTILSGSWDGTQKLWDAATGSLLANILSFPDGRWAVTDADGRFDVADLEDLPNLHWVMPDDPFTPVPLEIFMRAYFEPQLLSRIMNGENFKPVRALTDLNRVQPGVRITRIVPDQELSGYVNVSVEAVGTRRAYTPDKPTIATAAHDLRLFRNGQMVAYVEGKLAEAGGKPYTHTFRVRLPAGKAPLQFTAYAFNNDRVKSATARQSYSPAAEVVAANPRAYLINVGVNRHDNPDWDLLYAVNDARKIGQSLALRLAGRSDYEEIVTLALVSDTTGPNMATKANLKSVLDVLAGRQADVQDIPGGAQLRQATPDDLVLISFSGHGYNEGGLFYLVPSDTGPGKSPAINPEFMARSISSDELGAWLKDVDAGDMVMIVDACHSAASVGDEFKPGPMGSRGLGQLAFDKGMRILAATQADDVAIESDLIRHGLLTFALVHDGLDGQQADYQPRDRKIMLAEWLNYGAVRVPLLLDEVMAGTLVAPRGVRAIGITRGTSKNGRALQQPALFDFTKGRRDVALDVVAGGVNP